MRGECGGMAVGEHPSREAKHNDLTSNISLGSHRSYYVMNEIIASELRYHGRRAHAHIQPSWNVYESAVGRRRAIDGNASRKTTDSVMFLQQDVNVRLVRE